MISIAIPVYDMPNKEYFLKRCIDSITRQTYKDYEIVVSENGKGMPQNTNEAMRKCKGDYIKILFMDDYLAHDDALQKIVDEIDRRGSVTWLATACNHDPGGHVHEPVYNYNMHLGFNTIGSPSVLTLKNGLNMYFDENLSWHLDCDLYRRLYDKYSWPVTLNNVNVTIGLHPGQATHLMGEERKQKESEYMQKKYNEKK